jgi:putative addiction module CopG family antidote
VAAGILYAEDEEAGSRNAMTIHLTPEQERRIQAVIRRGGYGSVEEVVEAALSAVEQRIVPGFAGTQQELEALLAEGLASPELSEDEFWGRVNQQTDAMLAEHKSGPRS